METILRIYKRLPADRYELMIGTDLEAFGGVCPNVGDNIATWLTGRPFAYFVVQSRCFVECPRGDRGWALIVEDVGPAQPLVNLVEDWAEDSKFFRECEEAEEAEEAAAAEQAKLENLDRTNRDPAYWTPERKAILRREREANIAATKSERDRKPKGKLGRS